MKDKYGIDDLDILDDSGVRPDMYAHMNYLMELASKSAFVIELGIEYGNGSTKAFSWGMRKSEKEPKLMISVDIENKLTDYRIPTEPWWNLIIGNSASSETIEKVVPLVPEGLKADIIFVDSEHTEGHVMMELDLWSKFADDKTVWLFHDVHDGKGPEIINAINRFAEEKGLTFELISTHCTGLGKLFKKEK